jgi:hypothetical protein
LNEEAYKWIRRELDDIALRDIARLRCDYVPAGGEIDEITERRPEWSDLFECHFDLRFAYPQGDGPGRSDRHSAEPENSALRGAAV